MHIDVELPEPDEVLEDGTLQLLERTVKRDGVWRVHLNDPDTNFPSDFHAHNQDARETLDVYTGNVFDPSNRRPTRTLSKKVMRYLYRQLATSGEQNFVSKCAEKHLFPYL